MVPRKRFSSFSEKDENLFIFYGGSDDKNNFNYFVADTNVFRFACCNIWETIRQWLKKPRHQ